MERIKELRNRYHLTCYAVGKAFGVNASSVIRSEGPGVNCRANITERYARYFGVSTDYLIGKTETGFIVAYEDGGGFVHYADVTGAQLDALKEMGGLDERVTEKGITRVATGEAREALMRKKDAGNYLEPPPTESEYVMRYRMLDLFERQMVDELMENLLVRDGKITK